MNLLILCNWQRFKGLAANILAALITVLPGWFGSMIVLPMVGHILGIKVAALFLAIAQFLAITPVEGSSSPTQSRHNGYKY
ncbi:MAG: hypothetical protein VB084_02650 [Syntrophomonadaceae bacterium]|nr:hypothetical protein [Syntrophomonadaceae bacterium]